MGTRSSPRISFDQNGGPVDIITIASSQCKALFGLFSLNSNKSFVLSSSPNCGFRLDWMVSFFQR